MKLVAIYSVIYLFHSSYPLFNSKYSHLQREGHIKQTLLSAFEPQKVHVNIHWNTASFSDAEGRNRRQNQSFRPDRKTISWMAGMKDSLETVLLAHTLPSAHLDIHVTILQADGSILACVINALSLALMDAGLPMSDILCACSVGLASSSLIDESVNTLSTRPQNWRIRNQHQNYTPIVDLTDSEERSGHMPVLTAAFLPRSNLVSFLHMESKVPATEVEGMIEVAKAAIKVAHSRIRAVFVRNK